MTRAYTVCKADPVPQDEYVEGVALLIVDRLPHFPDGPGDLEMHLDQLDAFYEGQASQILSAFEVLPGGVWDRVLTKMLEKKASHFRVPLFGLGKK